MFHIDEAEVRHIRENADIVEIIKSYIPLTQKGKNYFGVCPFHDDHSPSMSVSKEKGIYKCFSCGATGNVFKFVSDYENVSFGESVKIVAEKMGLTLKSTIEIKKETKNKEEYQVMELASIFYQNNLMTEKGTKALEYLNQRGLDETMIKDFQIGLALDKNSLYTFLSKKKWSEKRMVDLGLVSQNGLSYNDIFVNRIMFPIHNLNGQVVGFTGRIYLENSSPPKYMNSKETIIFKKGNILFNYHRAKEFVRAKKELIITEGNMDAIRMYSCGFKNTIALMGTSMTNNQIEEIKKLRVPIILMLDNDDAGNIATFQNGTLLEKENVTVKVVRLSKEKDPDEYLLANGPEKMAENIKNAISFLEFKLMYYKQNKNLNDSEDLTTYIKEVLKSLQNETDIIKKEVAIKKLSEDVGISLEILKQELSSENAKTPIIKQEEEKAPKKITRNQIAINHVLYYMMNDKKYIVMYKNKLGFLEDATMRGIANEIMAYYEIHKTICYADFLSYVETSKLKNEIYEIIESIKEESLDENSMEEYLNIIKKTRKEKEIQKLKIEQKNEPDPNKKLEIGCRIQELKKEVEK